MFLELAIKLFSLNHKKNTLAQIFHQVSFDAVAG